LSDPLQKKEYGVKFMTPREYARLLYESFFKAITLTEKTRKWSRRG
jgi:hypothetical protein